jgi:hypothetical protein
MRNRIGGSENEILALPLFTRHDSCHFKISASTSHRLICIVVAHSFGNSGVEDFAGGCSNFQVGSTRATDCQVSETTNATAASLWVSKLCCLA